MTKNSRSSTCEGFSLVEVAIALGVAAVVFVSLLGLIAVGQNTNKESSDRTAAAMIAASIIADLRTTPVSIPPAEKSSPRFQIPLPVSGNAMHTIFLRDDCSAAGAVDTDANATLDARYRVTLFITAPADTTQKNATVTRVLITWPALADPAAQTLPSKYVGSFEAVTALNRN